MSTYELIAACWTSAGACDASPTTSDDSSPIPIRERVEAVGRAGFKGLGIGHRDLLRAEREIGLRAFRSLLDDNGIAHLELESLANWFADGPARAASDIVRADLLRAAETIGARHIKIGADFAGGSFIPERLAPHLLELAQDADNVGTKVGIEPMPFADVKTPEQGLQLVRMVNHPAAGLFVDAWHVGRAGVDMSTLASLPIEWIVGIELDDAPREFVGSMLQDTFDGRLFPGEGDLDIAGFVAAIKATGYSGPWGVEMLSIEFRRLAVAEATQRAYDTSIAFLEASQAGA